MKVPAPRTGIAAAASVGAEALHSSEGCTAIDDDGLPGDVARLVRR